MHSWIVAITEQQSGAVLSAAPWAPARLNSEATLLQAAMQSMRSIGLPVERNCVTKEAARYIEMVVKIIPGFRRRPTLAYLGEVDPGE